MIYLVLQRNYLNLRTGSNLSLSAAVSNCFDLCFTRHVASNFSFHGKTKRSFKALHLYKVMNGMYIYNEFLTIIQSIS